MAEYKNGTRFSGENTRFADIDMTQVRTFGWYAVRGGKPSFVLKLKEGEEGIAFRRHCLPAGGQDRVVKYGLGVSGRYLMLIDADGSVEVE